MLSDIYKVIQSQCISIFPAIFIVPRLSVSPKFLLYNALYNECLLIAFVTL